MRDFSKFEGILNALVWRQQPAQTLNYLCIASNCHSTCGVDHSVAGVFLLFPRQFSSCSKCNHPHLSHFHLYSTWEQVYGAQLSVDDNTRRQWEAAKDEKERTKALLATSKRALEDLSRIIDEAMDELARSAEEYASLSLSGSFSAPLEKAVWLLEQRCRGMEENGVGLELLTKVRSSLEHMKGRLDLLRKAKEKNLLRKPREKDLRGKAKETDLRKAREKDLLRKATEKMWGRIEGRARDRARKVEEDVHGTVRTIEEEKQEGVSLFWGEIKDKVRAGFWK